MNLWSRTTAAINYEDVVINSIKGSAEIQDVE